MIDFNDSKGNPVFKGDKIKITIHHTSHYLENKEATVLWDSKHGMFKYRIVEIRRGKEFTTTEDFYGVHSFEKITL